MDSSKSPILLAQVDMTIQNLRTADLQWLTNLIPGPERFEYMALGGYSEVYIEEELIRKYYNECYIFTTYKL